MAKEHSKRSRAQKEQDELETAYRGMSGSPKKAKQTSKGNRTAAIVAICIALVAIAVGVAAGSIYFMRAELDGIILENVCVAGVDVGGMTQADAIEAVQAVSGAYKTTPMVVKVLDEQAEIPAGYAGALDVKAAVKAAYKFGNSGTPSKRQQEQQIAMSTGYTVDLTPYLEVNEEGIRQILAQLGSKYNSTLSQSTYEVVGTAPDQKLVVKLGVPEYGLDLDALYEQVLAAYSANRFLVEGECGMIEPDPVDLEAIHKDYYVAPVDARFDPETFEVIEGTNGYGFDVDSAREKLQANPYGSTVEIPFTAVTPEITGETLTSLLYRDELASYTAASGSDSNRDTNLRLACEAINGKILYPGDVFSYNDILGERTAERGYKPGNSYVGNKTVKTIGGGICQVSSSLYYCALVAELEILVRENHSFAPSYVPLGMDATVSWGSIDFRFKNTLSYPIRIEATASGGTTTVRLVGTHNGEYYVELEYEEVSSIDYAVTYQTMSADNAEGYKDGDYITTPYTGHVVKTYRCKYNAETKELISRDFIDKSTYDKRDGVICKIEGSTPTEPENSDDPGIGNGRVTE